jgi:hypothetical protein
MFFSNIFSASNRREVCEHAYQSTLAQLREQREAMDAKLRKHGMRLRPEVLADARRTLFEDLDRAPDTVGVMGDIRGVLDRLGDVLDRIEQAA